MGNISYFCIVKRFTTHLKYLLVLVAFLLTTQQTNAQVDSVLLKSMDSVKISLLTCGPGDQIYSYYGHTAIHYNDVGRQQDIVVNYGMFSFQKSYFILRFVFGLTDYEMGIQDINDFIASYARRGSWVKEQQLNLTREEKWAITQAIDVNYRPENRIYRYNYFYDNCTTRARDMIVNHINGNVLYAENKNVTTSYRQMIHQWNEQYRWARFGNDLLLGVKADAKTDNAQQQFLPDSLREDFAHALVIDRQGQRRNLVESTSYLIQPIEKPVEKAAVTPVVCAILWLILTLITCLVEWKTGRILWVYDLVAMLVTGTAGLILLAMVFSQHPTVQLNFQILLLCPLNLFYLFPTIKALRMDRIHSYIKLYSLLLVANLMLAFFQTYAEGMVIVALSLLLRYGWLMIHTYRKPVK